MRIEGGSYDSSMKWTAWSSEIALNTWHHLAYVRYNNKVYMYVNGTATDSGTTIGSLRNNSTSVLIGKRIYGTNTNAYLDDIRITKDLGKLAWKVEFAARWTAFDIRFEAYGKDIMDSVKVNDWVADEILECPHPHHVKYEMFLDKGGKKISKSLGNVITAQKWLEFGTPKSILLLLYKRITGARELGFEDIPSLMSEYNELEDIYFGRIKIDNQAKVTKSKGLYEYVNLLNPPKQSSIHVNYRLLIELTKIFKENSGCQGN